MKSAYIFALLGLISNAFSYKLQDADHIKFPELINYYKTYDNENGFPRVEVVKGPNHYEDNEQYIDVYGTIDNYIKTNLPGVEYRVTDDIHRFGSTVFIDMIQQYKGVDIEGTYFRFGLDAESGNFDKIQADIISDFSGADFENRDELTKDARIVLNKFTESQFEGVFDLSKVYINSEIYDEQTNEYEIRNLPFAKLDSYIKKTYLIIDSTTVQPAWKLRFDYVYQDKKSGKGRDNYSGGENQSTVYLNDENGEVIVGVNFDFHEGDVQKFGQKSTTAKQIPVSTTPTKQVPVSTTPTKQIPVSTTPTKQVPVSTTPTKQIPGSTTPSKQIPVSTTPTKQIPVSTTPSKQIPVSTTPSKQIPGSTTPSKQIPGSTTPTKQIPVSTTPTKQIPSSTTPTKQIPSSTKQIPCQNVTVTVYQTVTVKETITVGPQPTSGPSSCAPKWAQCGGQGYSGPTCCQSGSSCHGYNQWYSQCI